MLGFERKKEVQENSNYFRTNAQLESRFQISFGADETFMKLLERAKELSFHGKKEDLALENVIGQALRAYVERKYPKEREARRRARRERARELKAKRVTEAAARAGVAVSETQRVAANISAGQTPTLSEVSRHIPAQLRDQVLTRDGHRCTYVGPSGVRCCSRMDLEIDHILAFALGGVTRLENLCTLCAGHNLERAREVFGRGFVEARIAKRLNGTPSKLTQL